jgi:2'-hydroxyisoflavone reductase
VYSDFSIKNMGEDGPLVKLDDPKVEKVTGETYGGLKVLCENAVLQAFGENATILRPTYIVGPGDHTDRFIHYIHRPLLGGRMAVPGKPSNPLSYIDVRDLAKFTEHAIANNLSGVYNTVEKPNSANFGQLIETSISLSQSEVTTTWVDGEFLAAQQEMMGDSYAMFPMWHDQDNADFAGFTSQAKAEAVGLTHRPFKDTVTDTYNWWIEQSQARRDKRRIHITQEFEKALLLAWDDAKNV